MWSSKRKTADDGFPGGFSAQRIQSSAANAVADLAPADIVAYFRDHPETAEALLHESQDKRFTPSSFIQEANSGFEVGWFTRKAEHECVRTFATLADAATDYLLFSLGKGRWTPLNPDHPS